VSGILGQGADHALQRDVPPKSRDLPARQTLIDTFQVVAVIATRVRHPKVLLINGIEAETIIEMTIEIGIDTRIETFVIRVMTRNHAERVDHAVADERGVVTETTKQEVEVAALLLDVKEIRGGIVVEVATGIGIGDGTEAETVIANVIEIGKEAEVVEVEEIPGETKLFGLGISTGAYGTGIKMRIVTKYS